MLGNAETMGHGGRGPQTATLSAVINASPPFDAPAATPPLFDLGCLCLFSAESEIPPNHSHCLHEGTGRRACLPEAIGRQHRQGQRQLRAVRVSLGRGGQQMGSVHDLPDGAVSFVFAVPA